MGSSVSRDAARTFIEALYAQDEHIAVLAVKRGVDGPPVQRILTAERAAAEPFQRWLRHLNATNHDVFIGMNPLTGEPRRGRDGRLRPMREKPDVARVRRLQLDLDSDGPGSLRRVLADTAAGRLPAPAIVLRSSKDHYQVLWHTADGWSPEQAEDIMARLAARYDGDNVNDVARCMRLPGFRNKKQGRDDAAVTWTDYGGDPVRPEQFAHLPPAADRRRAPGRARSRPRAGPVSQSERDWAAVCDRLRRGDDPGTVTAELQAARPDKHNPRDYAERTVRNALERLRLSALAR